MHLIYAFDTYHMCITVRYVTRNMSFNPLNTNSLHVWPETYIQLYTYTLYSTSIYPFFYIIDSI